MTENLPELSEDLCEFSRESGHSLGAVTGTERMERGLLATSENGAIEVRILAEDIVRIRVQRSGQNEPDASWAVVDREWPRVDFHVLESPAEVEIKTSGVSVRISKLDSAMTVQRKTGAPLLENAAVSWDGERPVLAWEQPAERHIYGCGEKAGGLERRGEPMTFWNAEHYGYGPGYDPLYQSIPFYLAMDGPRAHGFFLDNTYRTVWELGRPGTTQARIEADGGAIDLYVIAADDAKTVLGRWADLVGHVPMPPLWAVGYQQSRWSYYPEHVVRDLAANFRRRRIPCDVIYFDIDYMDAYKDFTWHGERFPDPRQLLADLRDDGFQSIVILDPGVKVEDGYSAYEELRAAGFAVKNADGSDFVGPVWPGDCLFPDYTDAACRAWWGTKYAGLLDDGVAGFWNDMNEPAVFDVEGHTMPPDVRFAGGGQPGNHLQYHNIYGMEMARATYEGVRVLRPDERAYVLTRANYAGGHRYAATWTGDNAADWPSMRLSIPMVLNLGLSGQGISGPDIGGFVGDPSPELFARWLQFAALFPFCRVHHAASSHEGVFDLEGAGSQEPWSYGPEWESINRASIELRYRLLPYMYTVFEEMCRTGIPALRPLFLEFPDDAGCAQIDDQFLLGASLMAAPILHEGANTRLVYFPDGLWYDFWTGEPIAGGREIAVHAPLDRLPLYARAGSVIALQPVIQHTGESKDQPIQYRVYLDNDHAEGGVYEDDGHSMRFETGDFRRTRVKADTPGGQIRITVESEGPFTSPRPNPTFEVVGWNQP